MQYLYQIAGISVLCDIPFPVHIRKEAADFMRLVENGESNADMVVCFTPVSGMKTMPSDGHWDIDRYHVGLSVYYCSSPGGKPYAQVYCDSSNPEKVICKYIRGKETFLNYSHNICDIIALDMLLLKHRGLLLHASFIRWNSQGILFSAPSGTGKSTQADLWVNYEQAEIINGDRAGLRRMEEGWKAYGLPYAGSSEIYRNESAPVKAIIVLRQGKENRIRKLKAAEATGYLYSELTIRRWDRKFTEQAMNLLMELVMEIPVYFLECLPDRDAVKLVKQTIFMNKKKEG